MKKVFHKTVSLLMAFVVFFSTMSFTVNMHYCGDILVETAVFHKVNGCGMEKDGPVPQGCAISKKNCCHDKKLTVDGQDELQFSTDKVSLEQQVFITSFLYAYINLFEGFDGNSFTYQCYKPPLVIRQLYKIDETYLI